MGVKDAWSLCAGGPRIVVAVFDEGVRVSHDDLKDAMWVNPGETSNGKDDDNNGYADDINGIEGIPSIQVKTGERIPRTCIRPRDKERKAGADLQQGRRKQDQTVFKRRQGQLP